MDVAKRLETLKRLLDQKQQPPAPREEVVDAVFDDDEREKNILKNEEPVEPNLAPQTIDPDNRPPSLEGLSTWEIILAANDGDEIAEEYLSYKSVPMMNGWRMPSIKYLSRRKAK
jgi:hypothetical protein